jgi:elongation factor G
MSNQSTRANVKPTDTRCVAVVGPQSSGKTTLVESMLVAAGALPRRGNIMAGTVVSDISPEARTRQMSTEITPVRMCYLGDPWIVLDCPGAVDLVHESHEAMMVADAVIVVVDPDEVRMLALGPILRFLDARKIPHVLFVNKIDSDGDKVEDLLAAAQRQSTRPLVLRHAAIAESGHITGYVDLAAERAYHYVEDKASERIPLERAADCDVDDARRQLLEKLSDFDDTLLEKLLEDIVPDRAEVYRHLTRDLQEDLIVPVMIGAAEHGHGIRRLLKALRHEVPLPHVTAERLGIPQSPVAAQIFRTVHAPHVGKLSLVRVWRGPLKDGDMLAGIRVTNIQEIAEPRPGKNAKTQVASEGAVVALGKFEAGTTGEILTDTAVIAPPSWPAPPVPLFTVAVSTKERKDDVKLGDALRKICEEDPSLSLDHVPETAELLLRGQGDIHLSIALERLRRKFDLVVETRTPQVPYRETIRKGITHHARHKRQSGGHGQFADIRVEIKPLPRGSGFVFTDGIVGGVVPKNFIPAVEAGLKDNTAHGPLGFNVVDINVRLYDGQYHSVDSSDQAFRTAGRLATTEGLPHCEPVLLEPIYDVKIYMPTEFTSKVQRAMSQRRAQILGFNAREGWDGWEEIHVNMPEAAMQDLITEIRSITQGIGTFDAVFSRYQELIGRDAERVVQTRKQNIGAAHP